MGRIRIPALLSLWLLLLFCCFTCGVASLCLVLCCVVLCCVVLCCVVLCCVVLCLHRFGFGLVSRGAGCDVSCVLLLWLLWRRLLGYCSDWELRQLRNNPTPHQCRDNDWVFLLLRSILQSKCQRGRGGGLRPSSIRYSLYLVLWFAVESVDRYRLSMDDRVVLLCSFGVLGRNVIVIVPVNRIDGKEICDVSRRDLV